MHRSTCLLALAILAFPLFPTGTASAQRGYAISAFDLYIDGEDVPSNTPLEAGQAFEVDFFLAQRGLFREVHSAGTLTFDLDGAEVGGACDVKKPETCLPRLSSLLYPNFDCQGGTDGDPLTCTWNEIPAQDLDGGGLTTGTPLLLVAPVVTEAKGFTITATVNPSEAGPPGYAGTQKIALNVRPAGANVTDLQTTLSIPESVPPGAEFSFDVTIRNLGPNTSETFAIIAAGPTITSVDPAEGCAVSTAGVLRCDGKGPLAPGGSTTITVTGRAPEKQDGEHVDFIVQGRWLNLNAEDPVPGNDLVIDRIPFGEGGGDPTDLSIDCGREVVDGDEAGGKTQDEVAVGQRVRDTCTLTNLGAAASGVTVGLIDTGIDVLPVGPPTGDLTCDQAVCETDRLEPGATVTTTRTFVAKEPGELTTAFLATSSSDDDDFGNNTAILVTTFFDADAPDIAITIDAPEKVLGLKTPSLPSRSVYGFRVIVENREEPPSAAYDLRIVASPTTTDNQFDFRQAFRDVPPECNAVDHLHATCSITEILGPEKRLDFELDVLFSEDFTQEIVVTATPVNPAIDKDWSNHFEIQETVEIVAALPESPRWNPEEPTLVAGSMVVSDLHIPNSGSSPLPTIVSIPTDLGGISIGEVYIDDSGIVCLDEGAGVFTCTFTIEPGDVEIISVLLGLEDTGQSDLCATIESAGQPDQDVCTTIAVEPERPLPDLFIIGTPITEDGGRDDPFVRSDEQYTLEVKAWNIGRETSTGSLTRIEAGSLVLDPLPEGCLRSELFPNLHVFCETGPLAPGTSRTFLFTVPAPRADIARHRLEIIPDGLDEDETNHQWISTMRLVEEEVVFDILAPRQVIRNQEAPIRITIGNRGDEATENVQLKIDWPGGLLDSPRCSPEEKCDVETDGSTATAELKSLDPKDVVEFFYSMLAEAKGKSELTVTATEGEADIFGQSVAIEVIDTAPCTVTKTIGDDATPPVGRPFAYNLTVAAGDDPVADVNLSDQLPEGLLVPRSIGLRPRFAAPDDCEYTGPDPFEPATGLECHFPLGARETRTVPFIVEAVRPGVANNIVAACGLTADEAVDPQDLDIRIRPNTIDDIEIRTDLGAYFNIETIVTNTGSEAAPDVQVHFGLGQAFESDVLVTRLRSSDQCTLSERGLTADCALGMLAPGESREIALFALAEREGIDVIDASATSSDDREGRDEVLIFVASREIRMEWANATPDGFGKQTASYDIYVDGTLVTEDLAPGGATAFLPVTIAKTALRIDVTDATESDNSDPLATFTVNLVGTPDDSLAFSEHSLLILTHTPGDTLGLVVKTGARIESGDPTTSDVVFVHAGQDAPPVQLRLTGVNTAIPPLEHGQTSDYLTLKARTHRVGVLDAATSEELHGFRFDLSDRAGEAVAFVLTGRIDDGTLDLLAFDGQGNAVVTPIEATTDVPDRFVLHGNYPNPFNPTTRLRFDLPEPAEVRVEVFNVLGRRVLVLPPAHVKAGFGHTLELDGSTLASGVHLYRITATMPTRTKTQTGRMVLVK